MHSAFGAGWAAGAAWRKQWFIKLLGEKMIRDAEQKEQLGILKLDKD